MKTFDYNKASFLISVDSLQQLPADQGAEVAFIGRSNAGKSSAINAITSINNLARTSKTPGRTQLINLFSLDDEHRLVDLPGYGYAKAPKASKERWQKLVDRYLETRQTLRGLVLVMDIRHPLKELDQHMIHWAVHCNLPIHILLTKADKLKRGPAMNTLQKVRSTLEPYANLVSLQLFSSHKSTGVEEAHAQLNDWLTSK